MEGKDCREIFKKNSIKTTKQRELVFGVLTDSDVPLTVEEIYVILMEQEKNMSLSTIYRILDVFVSKNLVQKSNITDNKAVYEVIGIGHKHHIICISCGKIIALDHCPIKEYEIALENETKFEIISHKLVFFGYCPDCKKK
ncbi:ferric uptake regulation protein [Anaerotignum neopropionicum]|uniref:Ferric uptake regulation protein n=1 Tax=Anaerotignum neopropionicum TaxID=36847 RepID=A0A136WF75_9FIRM|nr:Fur family transcriptional regulator [Anaerotignum neopropionicum]KXL52999.1 ferric uptake regulation protein [Anaerotignum neopropionicum]